MHVDNAEIDKLLGKIDPNINLLNEALPLNMCKYLTVQEMNDIENFHESFSIINYNVRSFHSNFENFIAMLNTLNH